MKKLTLTIVIPVYNEEDHIIPCLEAILAQTVKPLEIIVVDNNCNDETIRLAKSFEGVRVVREEKPGIAHARNAGFDAARGDIIGRIDADSRLPVDWVEKALEHASKYPDQLLTGGSYMYDMPFPRLFGWLQEYFAFYVNKLIIGEFIAWGSNLVLSKKMWQEVRASVSCDNDIHEDIDLGLRLNSLGYKVKYDRKRKVGIESRVFSPRRQTRSQHFKYLMMWPNTLYAHSLKRAWLGTVGAYVIYYGFLPLLLSYRFSEMVRSLKIAFLGKF